MALKDLKIVTNPTTREIRITGGDAWVKTVSRDGHPGIEINHQEFVPFPGTEFNAKRGPDFGALATN